MFFFDTVSAAISMIRSSSHLCRLLAVPLAVVIVSCTPSVLKDDHIEVGTILSKEVLGITATDTVQLVLASEDEFSYCNEQIASFVSAADDNMTLSADADTRLRQTYLDIKYRVTVRLCIRRTIEEYYIERELFNLLRLGIISKFRLDSEEVVIDSLIAY